MWFNRLGAWLTRILLLWEHRYFCRITDSLYNRNQELMSHMKGGEGAFNYVETVLAKVCKCCDHVWQEGNTLCGSLQVWANNPKITLIWSWKAILL